MVDQSAIGKTPRSNPVTYLKAFAAVRDIFASQRRSVRRGYKSGRFSFNVSGGRCARCQGVGYERIEMEPETDRDRDRERGRDRDKTRIENRKRTKI